MTEGWAILTVKWRHRERTVKLAETLAAEGIETWVPIEQRRVSVPRMNASREVRLPLLPGYIFARRCHLVDLIQMVERHPFLRLSRTAEGFDIASDRALDGLRNREQHLAERYTAEGRKLKVKAAKELNPGDRIRARDGSFGGKTGVVTSSDKRRTIVCFDRFFDRVEISTSLLTENEAYELQSETDCAARKAA